MSHACVYLSVLGRGKKIRMNPSTKLYTCICVIELPEVDVIHTVTNMQVCSAVNSAIQTAYMNLQSTKTHSRSKSAQPVVKVHN